jgi:hypothetical protein
MRKKMEEIEVATPKGIRRGDGSAVKTLDLVLDLRVLRRDIGTGCLLNCPMLL